MCKDLLDPFKNLSSMLQVFSQDVLCVQHEVDSLSNLPFLHGFEGYLCHLLDSKTISVSI